MKCRWKFPQDVKKGGFDIAECNRGSNFDAVEGGQKPSGLLFVSELSLLNNKIWPDLHLLTILHGYGTWYVNIHSPQPSPLHIFNIYHLTFITLISHISSIYPSLSAPRHYGSIRSGLPGALRGPATERSPRNASRAHLCCFDSIH
jgi:hypothetical protein